MSFGELLFGDTISIICNIIILLGGLVLWFNLSQIHKEMEKHLQGVRDRFSTAHKQQKVTDDGLTVVTSETSAFAAEDLNISKRNYDAICAKFNTCAQLVPIFPSLGILGTVAGLMLQVSANGIEEMTGAIGTALSTTFWALIVTILLKAYIALSVTKTMSDVDIEYRDNDRYHQEYVEKLNR